MRNNFLLLSAVLSVAALGSGCANVERKFGRGMANAHEIIRAGEFRRTMEQSALFDTPDHTYTVGFVRGINRTMARTVIGFSGGPIAPGVPGNRFRVLSGQ